MIPNQDENGIRLRYLGNQASEIRNQIQTVLARLDSDYDTPYDPDA